MNLLIVEDDNEVRSALSRIAAMLFKDIKATASAYEAMVIIEQHYPQIVVSDWDLGGDLSGIDVANYATQNSIKTKLILITGKSMQQLKAQTAHLSVDHYMAKPFSVAEFRAVLSNISTQAM